MKKTVLTLALLLTCLAGFAQTAKDFVEKMKDIKGVEVMTIPKSMMRMAMSQVDDENAKKVLKNIDEVTIMQLNKPSAETLETFRKGISELTGNGYESMMQANEEDESVNIIAKKNGDELVEVVISVEEKKEIAFIIIKGKFKEEDLKVLQDNMVE